MGMGFAPSAHAVGYHLPPPSAADRSSKLSIYLTHYTGSGALFDRERLVVKLLILFFADQFKGVSLHGPAMFDAGDDV